MARKRVEYGVAGVEVFSGKMETLTRALDSTVPSSVLDLPVSQLVLQVINGKQEFTSVQEAQSGRLVRAAIPVPSSTKHDVLAGVVIVETYVSESLLTKMEGITRQYREYKQIKEMKNPINAGAYLVIAIVTVMILFTSCRPLSCAAGSASVPGRPLRTPSSGCWSSVAAAAGPGLVALVFFGSRKSGARTDPWSAYDLFVVVEAHRPFFEALLAAGLCRRSPALMAAVSSVLPPSQVSIRLLSQERLPLRAKCSVLTVDQLTRETGPQRRDHFCVARLFQPTQLLHGRDARAAELVLDAVEGAHRATFAWARPGLAGEYCMELQADIVQRAWELSEELWTKYDELF